MATVAGDVRRPDLGSERLRRDRSILGLLLSLGLLLAALWPQPSGTQRTGVTAALHGLCIASDVSGHGLPRSHSHSDVDCCILCVSAGHCGNDLFALAAPFEATDWPSADAGARPAPRDQTPLHPIRAARGFAARASPVVS